MLIKLIRQLRIELADSSIWNQSVKNLIYDTGDAAWEADTGARTVTELPANAEAFYAAQTSKIIRSVVHNAASVNIPNSVGAFVDVVTVSAMGQCIKILSIDGTGGPIGIYSGSSGNEVQIGVISGSKNMEFIVNVPASTRISVRGLDTAISSGKFTLVFFGPTP